MAPRTVVWHLCSGTGGDSEAFRVHPDYEVYRFDSNPELSLVPHTSNLNILDWMDWEGRFPRPDIILAGPNCQQYSTLNRNRNPDEYDLSVPEAIRDIIDHFSPQWWWVENVRGAKEAFTRLYGRVTQVIGPFWLWGRFPHLDVRVSFTGKEAQRLGNKVIHIGEGSWKFNGNLYRKWDEEQNAHVPLVISQALLEAIESHISLEDFT